MGLLRNPMDQDASDAGERYLDGEVRKSGGDSPALGCADM